MNITNNLDKKFIKKSEKLITIILWLNIFSYIIQNLLSIVLFPLGINNFYTGLFIKKNTFTLINTLAITICIAACSFILIYFWGKYNYKKYAHLRRRKFPKNVTNHEIELYFNLPSSLVEKMQKDKIIILEKTII